ncbi:MAG: hypothetical protein A2293_10570 [Elusimicrobia bacterium RIFOXYB2_FULL_49_7]|nr:MAG: hypothetical protein A2293_10570 [Elusimicrobia bacterium RIFOXYB2_FULL_49_7]
MTRIDSETIALYADLHERLEIADKMRSIATLSGEFVTKKIKGGLYHYFQATLPFGRTQIYLGSDNPEIQSLIQNRTEGIAQTESDQRLFKRLGAQIMAGHVTPVPNEMAKVISKLSDCALFHAGAVLVGSIAFKVLETHLGVRFGNHVTTTQDIDIAGSLRVTLAIPDSKTDIPSAIAALKMGFFPVPGFSHKDPSTSYAIRGKTLRLDLLTLQEKGREEPVFISRFNAAAQPLKYLDYLIEDPIKAVLICGTPFLVTVPQPARFALHKLLISQKRNLSSAAKKQKDILQAKLLLEVLQEDRPGDIDMARTELIKKGANWEKKLLKASQENHILL